MATLILLSAMLLGQSAPDVPASETAEAREAIQLAREEVAKYTMQLNGNQGARLELRKEPVLRWTNHLRRRFYGDVFIWMHQGRPEAVATITNSFGASRAIETEAHSLSLTTFTAMRARRPMWHPSRAGIELRQVPQAPQVADAPTRRLQQMRVIARKFSAVASPGPEQLQLRLLTQPVFRYASTAPELVDGAMFVFANGTDPDMFLLLEARKTREATTWQFALARFNSHVALQTSYDGNVVWTVSRLPGTTIKDPNSPYFAFQRRFSDTSTKDAQ